MINSALKKYQEIDNIVFSLLFVLNLCKNKIDIDVPKNLDINQKIEKCCVCENSLDENILMPSQCFAINGTRGNRICID